jgi:hypothetical protein
MNRHIQTVDQVLRLEIAYSSELGAAGLTEAIIEALDKGGVLEEANVIYFKAEAPGQELIAIDIWAPDPEPADVEPPTIPAFTDCRCECHGEDNPNYEGTGCEHCQPEFNA